MKYTNSLITNNYIKDREDFNKLLKLYPTHNIIINYLFYRYIDGYDMHQYSLHLNDIDYKEKTFDYLRYSKEKEDVITRLYGPFLSGKDEDDKLIELLLSKFSCFDLVLIIINKIDDIKVEDIKSKILLQALKYELNNNFVKAISQYSLYLEQDISNQVIKDRIVFLTSYNKNYLLDYSDENMGKYLNESKCTNTFDFYNSLYFQRKGNPNLNDIVIDNKADIEFKAWVYNHLKHEQLNVDLIDVSSLDTQKHLELIKKYQSMVYENPDEPNDLASIIACSNYDNKKEKVNDYKNRIKGAIYGRFIGCMLGVPVEQFSLERMEKIALDAMMEYPLTSYWKEVVNANKSAYKADKVYCFRDDKISFVPVDDDINYVVLNILMLEKYGLNYKLSDVATFWNDYLPYACTAENEALLGIKRKVPNDKLAENNPFVETIGACIRADAFGYVYPGNPAKAAKLAYNDAFLSHRLNGIYGEMYLAAAISLAFSNSPLDAAKKAINYIPSKSRLYKDIIWALSYENKITDYKMARKILDERFPKMIGFHTYNNVCAIIFALFLGRNDFTKTISNTIAIGLDNDCTGATIGSIMGASLGFDKIDSYWYDRFNDTVHTNLRGYESLSIEKLIKKAIKMAKI